ncbi:hypothetical protein [Sporosarcina sp. FSL W7-1283]|uniref:hypothetical protein n=1 Tax=Sporosarcina sp. FSL W7-1283 TaxID=2921560 RepID=UPI0030F53E75
MTTVIVHVSENGSYILSDGRVSRRGGHFDSGIPKFIKFNGEEVFYACVSGSAKGFNLINHKIKELEQGCRLDLGYLNFELLPRILKLFKEQELEHDDCYLLFVGTQGIFHTSSLLGSLTHINNEYFCTGSGSELALGAIEVLLNDSSMTIKGKMLEAMKVATKFDESTGMPYYFLNVKREITEKILSL